MVYSVVPLNTKLSLFFPGHVMCLAVSFFPNLSALTNEQCRLQGILGNDGVAVESCYTVCLAGGGRGGGGGGEENQGVRGDMGRDM